MITIRVDGLDRLQKGMSKHARYKEQRFKYAMQDAVEEVKSRARKEAPSYRGELQQGIMGRVERWNLGVVGVREGIKYARAIEYGLKPHQAFPPIEALTGRREPLDLWVASRLGGGKGVAFAVARKIWNKGTKAQPYLSTGFKESRRAITGYFNDAIEKLLKDIRNG